MLIHVELIARHAGRLEVGLQAQTHDGRELVHVRRVGRGPLRRGEHRLEIEGLPRATLALGLRPEGEGQQPAAGRRRTRRLAEALALAWLAVRVRVSLKLGSVVRIRVSGQGQG